MRANEFLPDDVNEGNFNGVTIRKGSVGAFIVNARILENPESSAQSRAEATQHIVEALPALEALGLFAVLQVRNEALRKLVAQYVEGS